MPEHATRLSIARAFVRGVVSVIRARRQPVLAVPRPVFEFTGIVAGSPELVAALSDARVLAVLRDPQTQRELAQVLRVAAEPQPDPDAPLVH